MNWLHTFIYFKRHCCLYISSIFFLNFICTVCLFVVWAYWAFCFSWIALTSCSHLDGLVIFTEFTEARICKWCLFNCVNSRQTPNWQKDDRQFSEYFGLNESVADGFFPTPLTHTCDPPVPTDTPGRTGLGGRGRPNPTLLTCSVDHLTVVNEVSSRSGLTVGRREGEAHSYTWPQPCWA